MKSFTWFCQFFQVNVLKQTITNSFPALAMQYHTLTYLMYELSDCMIHQTYAPLAVGQCEFGVAIVISLP